MGAVSRTGRSTSKGGRKKARTLLCLAVSAMALLTILAPVMTAEDSSADSDSDFTISLIDASGNVIPETTPLISNYTIPFSTVTTPTGVNYVLETGIPIDSMPAYFVIRSNHDLGHNLFKVSVKMEGLPTWMDSYGIRVLSDDGSISDLRKGNSYDADFSENGKVKAFEFNKNYSISFATLDGSQSTTVPSSIGDFRITLTAEMIPGCHNIYLIAEKVKGHPVIIDKRVLYENEPLGELPDLDENGNSFIGWFDSNDKQVFATTLVSELPSDDIHAKWEWPHIDHWTETVENPDGSTTLIEYTRYTYQDGTITMDIVKTTTYPSGDSKKEETSETTDPEGHTTESYSSETDVTKHEDGSETWNTKEESKNSDGTSERYESKSEYNKDGTMVSEKTEAWLTDAEKVTREYEVDARLVDEKEMKYRVEAIIPETTIPDVDNAEKLIVKYNYNIAVVGTHSDSGLIIVPDDVMTEVANHGYYLSVSNDEQYVAIDDKVVKSLSDEGGEVRMQIKDIGQESMTDPQKETIGNNYAFSVVLTVNGIEISELDGYAEISIDPDVVKGRVYLVNDDGSKVPLDSKVDPVTGRITYLSNHLSVFMVVEDQHDGQQSIWPYIIMASIGFTSLSAFFVLANRRRRKYRVL